MSVAFPYDPEARRDTPLALKLKERITREGPIAASYLLPEFLCDPEHGYYKTKTVIGRAGDFITAPEISQTFGELIGLWCAVVWQQMGSPPAFDLIELGPGRGTLMADALRATSKVPGFHDVLSVKLLEINTVLIEQQRLALASYLPKIRWIESYETIDRPTIMLANEFLDTALPWQFQKTAQGWGFRQIALDAEDRLVFQPGSSYDQGEYPDDRWPDAPVGSIRERTSYMRDLPLSHMRRLEKPPLPPFCALFIDYGHYGELEGDSIQAVRNHAYEHPLTSPGEADLSAQVNFRDFADEVRTRWLAVDGPVTQAEFLGSLGITQRASKLIAANPSKANEIETGVARLMAPNGMGTRFKAIGVRSPGLPPLPGFPVAR